MNLRSLTERVRRGDVCGAMVGGRDAVGGQTPFPRECDFRELEQRERGASGRGGGGWPQRPTSRLAEQRWPLVAERSCPSGHSLADVAASSAVSIKVAGRSRARERRCKALKRNTFALPMAEGYLP